MTKESPRPPQTQERVSWGDVARVSANTEIESSTPAPLPQTEFPGGSTLQAGDHVDHPKFGLCAIHRIVGDFVHMAPETGRVIKLSQTIITFTPDRIENGRRVFTTSTQ